MSKVIIKLSESLEDNPETLFGLSIKSRPNLGDCLSLAICYEGVSTRKPSEDANLFNLHFQSVFSQSSDSVPGDSHQEDEVDPGCLNSVSTSFSKVKKILEQLNPNKAAGVDSIPVRLPKCAGAREMAYPI